MWLKGISSRKVTEVGASLADTFVTAVSPDKRKSGNTGQFKSPGPQLQAFMAQVDRDVAPMQLGLFRRAKLASSFKWRLLDAGFEAGVADELTQMLLVRLSAKPASAPVADEERFTTLSAGNNSERDVETLLSQAQACAARNAHSAAAEKYQQLLQLKPRHLLAVNNLGVSLYLMGRYREAEEQFRQAAGIQPKYADAQFNLGNLLREMGHVVESEMPLRRAVKQNPKHAESQVGLGLTVMLLGRLGEARECFERVLKIAPRHAGALCGLGQVASFEGRFDDAASMYKRALVFDTQMAAAWAGLARVRKMTSADGDWLRSAEKVASSGLPPAQEANLRFAIGKYFDDVGSFDKAFRNYERANSLQKSVVAKYDRDAWTRFVDDTIRVYPREAFDAASGGSDSVLPVFVTGMMRSGTSLVEQIIASHPDARGAGELQFWTDAMRKHAGVEGNRQLEAESRDKLAERYLLTLRSRFPDAARIVDKTTFNTRYLGPIHSAFPKARIIYVRRDPIDTCLSCYFQEFSAAHNFTYDLEDLAHYYREHRRLIDHWRAVLPAGTLLEVHYADLVEEKEKWTRRILEFIGLEWDEQCAQFHTATRPVLTSSFWQVRQKMYNNSLARWRNYEKFIGPLRGLQDLRS